MSSRAYYNEFDPKAAAWLRELIKGGLIAPGDVDERSITDVLPSDLHGYTQCHFFAGIGGWSYALRLAGVPDDQPIWTGSCPCQPFSAAGKQLGTADERHLWPALARLIQANRPPIVFGEQVASKGGREWLAGVFADLEGMAYYRAAADLCAAGVGAPHIRQRLYWVAYSGGERARRDPRAALGAKASAGSQRSANGLHLGNESVAGGATCALANSDSIGAERPRGSQLITDAGGEAGGVEHPACDGREQRRAESSGGSIVGGCGSLRMGSPIRKGLEGLTRDGDHGNQSGRERAEQARPIAETGGAWDSFDWLPCLDGKARRVESGTFPLAHGVSGRVGLLRGYGNAIVPQVAAQFIQAAFEAIGDHHGRSDVLMDDSAF